jgi:predicted DNA-binding protein
MRIMSMKIPQPLRERLEAESLRTGLGFSEILRRAIDEHLERRERAAATQPKKGQKFTLANSGR